MRWKSPSGRTISTSAIMGLIDTPPGDIVAGRMFFEGRDLATMTEEERRDINGRKIAMISSWSAERSATESDSASRCCTRA